MSQLTSVSFNYKCVSGKVIGLGAIEMQHEKFDAECRKRSGLWEGNTHWSFG